MTEINVEEYVCNTRSNNYTFKELYQAIYLVLMIEEKYGVDRIRNPLNHKGYRFIYCHKLTTRK